MKSRRRSKGRWLFAGGLAITAVLVKLVLLTRPDADAPAPPAAMSRLEREAAVRFAGSTPYVTMPDGRRLEPTNAAHVLQMKVKAYQRLLANELEERDPTFSLKAEAELERRRPLQAAIEWDDVTGNREMNFDIEDSSTCALDGKTELTLAVEDVARHPCLAQGGNFWDAGTQLKVHLTPVTRDDRRWGELLYAAKKAMATAAHLAAAEDAKGS